MNTSVRKNCKVLTLALVLIGGLSCLCQEATAATYKWYNKDIFNKTGKEGNDIHFQFGQVTLTDFKAAVVEVYTHPGFSPPTYELGLDMVVVKWVGPVPADPTNKIHLGVCLDLDKLNKPYLPAFGNVILTKDGNSIGKAAGCAKPEVVFESDSLVGIDITSPFDDPGITVDEVRYCFVSAPIALARLNGDNRDIKWISIPDAPANGFVLSPGRTVRAANVPIVPMSTHVLVAARVRFTGDSEVGAGHVFFQSALPRLVPAVSPRGLIVLVLLTAGVGCIVIVRRRQRIAA